MENEVADQKAKIEELEKASHHIQKIKRTNVNYQHIKQDIEAMALAELAREVDVDACYLILDAIGT